MITVKWCFVGFRRFCQYFDHIIIIWPNPELACSWEFPQRVHFLCLNRPPKMTNIFPESQCLIASHNFLPAKKYLQLPRHLSVFRPSRAIRRISFFDQTVSTGRLAPETQQNVARLASTLGLPVGGWNRWHRWEEDAAADGRCGGTGKSWWPPGVFLKGFLKANKNGSPGNDGWNEGLFGWLFDWWMGIYILFDEWWFMIDDWWWMEWCAR